MNKLQLIIIVILAWIVPVQDNKYDEKEAVIYYDVTNIVNDKDTIKSKLVYYFENYGQNERIDKLQNDILEESVIKLDGKYYIISHKNKNWRISIDEPKLLWLMEPVNDNLVKQKYVKSGVGIVADKTCEIYSSTDENIDGLPNWLNSTTKYWGWQKVPLKIKIKSERVDLLIAASKVQQRPIDSLLFKIPSSYKQVYR